MTLDDAIAYLKKMRRTLKEDQGRIARRNARRRFHGALRKLRHACDRDYPTIRKEQKKTDRIDKAAQTMHWRKFEHDVIKHVNRAWDMQIAQEFNENFCAKFDLKPKPIKFNFREGTTRLLGQHTADSLRLHRRLSDPERWRVLLHEIAHYRVHHHRRAFVRELATVYKTWRAFLRDRGSSPQADESPKRLTEALASDKLDDVVVVVSSEEAK